MKQKNSPVLALLGMPIGNLNDITFRQYEYLIKADLILCEEYKSASRILKHLGIQSDGRLELYNEHNQAEMLEEILSRIKQNKLTVLISDAGMPAFCDPGGALVKLAAHRDIKLEIVPGPTALGAALALFGQASDGFVFAGFPPRKTEERALFFRKFRNSKVPVVFYETPYRTKKFLGEIQKEMQDTNKKVFVAIDITADKEYILDVPVREIGRYESSIPKGPPVVILYESGNIQI